MSKIFKLNLVYNLTPGYIYGLSKLIWVDFSQFFLFFFKVKTM